MPKRKKSFNKIWTGEWKGFGLWIKKLCRDEIYQNKWEALRRSIYSHWCVCNTLILLDKGAIDQYIVLSLDEMYLDKGESYQGGKVLGKDDNGKLYKGFLAFMIVVVWKNIPCVVRAILEISLTGALVKKYIEENFHALSKIGFKVRAVVATTTRPTFRRFGIYFTPEQIRSWPFYPGNNWCCPFNQECTKKSSSKQAIYFPRISFRQIQRRGQCNRWRG